MAAHDQASVDDYPSLLWVIIPPVILLSAYFTRKWYLARRLRLHGIGKGAPGFQTNVRRIRVTPEIAARIRRGEEVSPDEIAAASAKAEAGDVTNAVSSSPKTEAQTTSSVEPVNEWLPQSIITPKKRAKGKRK
ncbi:hypothetical protein EV368DRAFT_68383 [Lentinula lateritia]|uniref:Uncharacterized protein n=1 Tax=Lentinula aff. lateritia TaxID=2804960 RepID=A0ACC1TKL3_9AGAR|nr:hypothetical protein F5876DRAFT_69958 [Lentinula aff. lateritia]KAJ3848311.1 hypothetical protein EV368DRAFT_68383 [Lentinula lateritia]